MDISKLTRDPKKVRAIFVEMEDDSIVTREGCKIYIPNRYINKGLAGIGDTVWSVGVFVIVTDSGSYSISSATSFLTLDPSDIRQVKLPDENMYYELYFPAGSVVFKSKWLSKTDKPIDPLFEEFVINGNIPYGFTVFDYAKLFRFANMYSGFSMGANNQIFESLVAITARDPKDLNKQWRYCNTKQTDAYTNPPVIVGLRNAARISTNTTAKLLGSYFGDARVSALINPPSRLEGVEEILRR